MINKGPGFFRSNDLAPLPPLPHLLLESCPTPVCCRLISLMGGGGGGGRDGGRVILYNCEKTKSSINHSIPSGVWRNFLKFGFDSVSNLLLTY
jgi:hypothetical protein